MSAWRNEPEVEHTEAVSQRRGALSASGRMKRSWQTTQQTVLPWLPVILLAGLVVIPLLLLCWFVFFTDLFVVQAITVTDARPHTTEAARAIIVERIARLPLQRNIFFVQTDILEKEVAARLPQVRTVHATRQLPGTLKVIIQEKTPALLFLSTGRYYFVDHDGIAYEEARLDTLPGVVLPKVKNSDPSTTVTLGVPVVAPAFVQFIQHLTTNLSDYVPAQVAEIRIPALSAREVHFLLNNNWEIRFDVTRDPQSQLAILQKLLESTVPPEEQSKIEYIDLRIPDRVYYRTLDAVPTTPQPTAEAAASDTSSQ